MLKYLSKSLSRTVHQCPEELQKGILKNHNNSNYDTEDDHRTVISLTVWRKSLIFSCNGFTVIGSDGSLVYRVDNYRGCSSDQIVLMDGSGNPIFTICRRKLRLVDCSWLVYDGEVGNNSSSKPIFHVRKNMNILEKSSKVLAYVYEYDGIYDKKKRAYTIEGTYTHRMCKILDESKRVVAEIKRKQDVAGGVSFGLEVFVLSVSPGYLDSGVAMAIVSLLDQMFS
ncbi:protein LURP-one-related 8-like [Henckelia pumila]|uniref:protein LURP-one-related 8-like n=1 Tax=Henckelia pumila TaxID=405737 RepID=UPI003C6DEE10